MRIDVGGSGACGIEQGQHVAPENMASGHDAPAVMITAKGFYPIHGSHDSSGKGLPEVVRVRGTFLSSRVQILIQQTAVGHDAPPWGTCQPTCPATRRSTPPQGHNPDGNGER